MLAAAENALLCNWMGVGFLITDAGRTSRDTKKKKKNRNDEEKGLISSIAPPFCERNS